MSNTVDQSSNKNTVKIKPWHIGIILAVCGLLSLAAFLVTQSEIEANKKSQNESVALQQVKRKECSIIVGKLSSETTSHLNTDNNSDDGSDIRLYNTKYAKFLAISPEGKVKLFVEGGPVLGQLFGSGTGKCFIKWQF